MHSSELANNKGTQVREDPNEEPMIVLDFMSLSGAVKTLMIALFYVPLTGTIMSSSANLYRLSNDAFNFDSFLAKRKHVCAALQCLRVNSIDRETRSA